MKGVGDRNFLWLVSPDCRYRLLLSAALGAVRSLIAHL